MANFELVIDSRYNPYTYQELINPVVMATQAHQQLEDAYGELSTKANVWANMANAQTDPRTRAQYERYADELKRQSDNLLENGLSPTSRQNLNNMKSRYSSEIIPIEQAYQRRQKLADEQRLGKAKGLIYDYDAATTSLDKFVFDNQKDYDSIDLNALYTKSKDSFGNIANELTKYGKGEPIDAYTRTFIKQHGITREQAAQFANDIREGRLDVTNPALRAVYNSLYSGTNVDSWNNRTASKQVMNTILSGATSAIGKTDVSPLEDYGARLAAQEAKEKRVAAYTHSLSNPDPTVPINKYKRRNAYSQNDIDKAILYWNLVKSFVYKDTNGKWRVNNTGRTKYAKEKNNTETQWKSANGAGSYKETIKGTSFTRAIDALQLNGLIEGKWGPYQQSKLDNIYNIANNTYDANKYTEYYRAVDDGDRGSLLRALQRVGRNGGTPTADWITDKQNGQTMQAGKKVDLSGLEAKDIKDAVTVVGQNGRYYEVTLSDNSVIRVPIASVFGDYSSRTAHMNQNDYNAMDWNDAINYDIDSAISAFGTTKVEDRKITQQ